MKIGIVFVPYITTEAQLKLAIVTLDSLNIASEKHELYKVAVVNKWVDGVRDLLTPRFDKVINNDENNLSKAWNIGITECMTEGCDYIVIPNLDIIFGARCIDNLVKFAAKNPDYLVWTPTEFSVDKIHEQCKCDDVLYSPNFSLFMITPKLITQVGWFDENFIAYHGDNDMVRRITLLGKKVARTKSARFWHYGSATIELAYNPVVMESEVGGGVTDGYYTRKHGGISDHETFIYPFNNVNKDWTNWERE